MQGSVKMLICQHNLPDISVFVIDHNLEYILSCEQPEGVFLLICNKTKSALPWFQHGLIIHNPPIKSVDRHNSIFDKMQDMPVCKSYIEDGFLFGSFPTTCIL